MHRSLYAPILVAFALAVALISGRTVARSAPVEYAIVDLGTLGGAESRAYALNNRGQVAGQADTAELKSGGDPIHHAFQWQAGRMQDLGTLGGDNSTARGENDLGEVVGDSDRHSGRSGAFRWRSQDGMTEVRAPAGITAVSDIILGANAINNKGQVTGTGRLDSEPTAFVWERGHLKLQWFTPGRGMGINDRGEIAGAALDDEGTGAPALWRFNGTRLRAPRLLVPQESPTRGFANCINERGVVGGQLDGTACLWTASGLIGLGVLPGLRASTALSVNGHADVVGVAYNISARDDAPDRRAFLWRPGAGMLDLNLLVPDGSGWVLEAATGINNRGQIAGTGLHNDVRRGFLLTPQ